jgi:hypothetical protein
MRMHGYAVRALTSELMPVFSDILAEMHFGTNVAITMLNACLKLNINAKI